MRHIFGLVTQTPGGGFKVVKEVLQGAGSFPFQSVPKPENTLAVGSMGLTLEAQEVLYRTLHEVWIKLTELEKLQAQTVSSSLLKPVTFLTLLCPGSIYALAYDEK